MRVEADQGRKNQRLRTRKDLLLAAARLLKKGRAPSMDDVTEEALVSRATAYRYFPNIEALLIEAPIDDAVPEPELLFSNDPSVDPEERVDRAEAALHDMVYKNETQLRLMLANCLEAGAKRAEADTSPVRQNRRIPLIEAALAPSRDQFEDAVYERLCASLALVFGTESMVVFRDVLPISERKAREVKSWAVRALVRSALEKSR